MKDGEERDQMMEDDSRDAELLPAYQWLLQDLPRLPLFDSVRGMTANALQQVSQRPASEQLSLTYMCYQGKLGRFVK